MPRPPLSLAVPEFDDPDQQAYAEQQHALNVQVTEFDWYRLREMVDIERAYARANGLEPRYTNVSDIVRHALGELLNKAPEAERIARLARLRVVQAVEIERVRDSESTDDET